MRIALGARHHRLLGVVAAAGLLLAACSAAGAGQAPSTAAPAPAAASSASAPTTSAPPTSSAAGSPPTAAVPAVVPASPTPAARPGAAALHVSSTVMDGPVASPVEWIATVTGVTDADPIDHVDFSIDGKVAWTEHHAPYQFNDDGNLFMPAVLAPGTHHLGIDAVTASGASATAGAVVTTTRPAVPASLLGKTFARAERATTSELPNGSTAPVPAGAWRITFEEDGVINVDDPSGGGANEGFAASADGKLALFGPANWIEPKDRQGGFCDTAEGVARMTWVLKGADLVLSAAEPDPCPGRAQLFVGTWQASH